MHTAKQLRTPGEGTALCPWNASPDTCTHAPERNEGGTHGHVPLLDQTNLPEGDKGTQERSAEKTPRLLGEANQLW